MVSALSVNVVLSTLGLLACNDTTRSEAQMLNIVGHTRSAARQADPRQRSVHVSGLVRNHTMSIYERCVTTVLRQQ